jgi:hypothetical protein
MGGREEMREDKRHGIRMSMVTQMHLRPKSWLRGLNRIQLQWKKEKINDWIYLFVPKLEVLSTSFANS